MSITIKHVEGPLAGKVQEFDDSYDTITFGREGDCQVVYPAEETAVAKMHLQLERTPSGDYSLKLLGGRSAEIDGKPASDGARIDSGSVVRLGSGGPTFEVQLPGVTVKHLTGPLAGQSQYFSAALPKIVVGRKPATADILYPETCNIVGRLHCSLNRKDLGNYCIELTPNHYVAIDGIPAENGAVVPSGSTIRLGDDSGPTFNIAIEQPKGAGATTIVNKPVVPIGKRMQQAIRVGGGAGAALAVLIVAGFYFLGSQQSALVKQFNDLQDTQAALALKEFSPAELDRAAGAVYLVVQKTGDTIVPMATAWAFGPDMLATNAHVTEHIDGAESTYFLVARNGTDIQFIPIKDVVSHPGHSEFNSFKDTLVQKGGKSFEPLDLVSEYDVGIIYTKDPLPNAPNSDKPAMLELASDEDLQQLTSEPVALIGFPIEGLVGSDVRFKSPPNRQYGYISAVTNVFMCTADPEHELLIQHSVPVAGGVSGSPLLMMKDGKIVVVGIVAGGNTADVPGGRIPNAALINFADRIDLLKDLRAGLDVAKQQLEKDKTEYWPTASKDFGRYYEAAYNKFLNQTEQLYGVDKPLDTEEIDHGALDPGPGAGRHFLTKTVTFTAEPGHVYGFIVNAESGVPLALNIKQVNEDGTTVYYRDAKDDRKTSVPELAPTGWVSKPMTVQLIISGLTDQKADYKLTVYDWTLPPPSADADSAASQQQP
jgi:hypothetical protein